MKLKFTLFVLFSIGISPGTDGALTRVSELLQKLVGDEVLPSGHRRKSSSQVLRIE